MVLAKSFIILINFHSISCRAAGNLGIKIFAITASPYITTQVSNAKVISKSAIWPPASEPSKIAAMVDASIKPFALTKLSPEVSSPKIPYFAGE